MTHVLFTHPNPRVQPASNLSPLQATATLHHIRGSGMPCGRANILLAHGVHMRFGPKQAIQKRIRQSSSINLCPLMIKYTPGSLSHQKPKTSTASLKHSHQTLLCVGLGVGVNVLPGLDFLLLHVSFVL